MFSSKTICLPIFTERLEIDQGCTRSCQEDPGDCREQVRTMRGQAVFAEFEKRKFRDHKSPQVTWSVPF